MKKYILLLLLVLFIFANNTHHTPFYSQGSISVPSNSQYSPSKNYGFQINWTDSTLGVGGVSTVIFETNLLGTLKNYTKYTTPSVNNNTAGIYWINFTGVGAGNYIYRWYANDTGNSFNFTNQMSYVIAKNNSVSIKLFLNGTEGNKTYDRYKIANFTVSLKLPSKTVYLNSTYPGWTQKSSGSSVIYNLTNVSALGLHKLTAYWNGDNNYTASSKIYYFDNIPPSFSNKKTYPPSFPFYSKNASYQFNISISDAKINNVWFESNHTGSYHNYTYPNVKNQSGVFWINLIDLPATRFVYRWIAKDDKNKFNSTIKELYRIYKNYALTFYISATSVAYGTQTVVVCYSNTNQLTVNDFKLYRNSALIANTSILSRDDISTLNIGTYVYECNTNGKQNYTNQSFSATLTVSAGTLPGDSGWPAAKELKISDVSSPTVNISESGEGTFNLSSTLDETLVNINVSLIGIPSDWYTVENVPSAILTGGSTTIKIKFDIPSEESEGEYNVTIRVSAKTETSNETKTVIQNMILTLTSPSPTPNQLPTYSNPSISNLTAGGSVVFSLRWVDDRGLSGYIFSTNNSGEWMNDSWIPLLGKTDVSISNKILNSEVGAVVAWKVYANDSNNLWVVSREFYLTTEEAKGEFDFIIIIIAVVIIVVVAVVGFIVYRIRLFKPKKKKGKVVYVYTRKEAP